MSNSSSRNGARVLWVTVHTAEGIRKASDLKAFFERSTNSSSHAVADDSTLLDGLVPYDRAAWTLRNGNNRSDNLELCGFAAWTRAEWLSNHQGMLNNAAAWIRSRCLARGIPIRKLTPAQVAAGMNGVIGHVDYTNATKDGTHWDPGPGFPWDVVIERAAGATPEPAKEEEDEDMSSDSGPATTGEEWGTLHVPLNGHQFLRIATSYGHAATLGGITLVDDTPSTGSGSTTKTVLASGRADADRPGPWNLANTDARFANYSHVVIRYQCAGPIKAWVNDRG